MTNLPVIYAAAFLAAFACSAALTAVVKKIAVKLNFVAHPRQDRFHKSIIPLGGGIAIFTAIALFCLTAAICAKIGKLPFYPKEFTNKSSELFIILACATVLFALGLWDDIKNLKPSTKLFVQFAAAFCAAYFADVRVELFIQSKIITSIISSVWIVLIINVFNFLDNMDGASAGIALIATIILFFAAAMSGQLFVAGFALLLAGSLAGFLLFNFFPASIFMGDAGSLVIGFFVAMLTLKTTYYQTGSTDKWYVVLMPLAIMALPLYDFITVTTLRLKQGKSPFVGDTQHFSHRLKKRGLSEVQTVLTLYLATLATGLSAIVLKIINSAFGLLVGVQIILVLAIVAILETTDKNDSTKQQ
ncbi:MAG: MraY family glycosyltransferase [Phycisphaerae bacterium]|jgi:UDP-GlcNAc:undecaprenyl-phosphate GlcNAc-1-phosphate transferase